MKRHYTSLLFALMILLHVGEPGGYAQPVIASYMELIGKEQQDVISILGKPSEMKSADKVIGAKIRNTKTGLVLVYELPKILVILDGKGNVLTIRAHDKRDALPKPQ
jgi:hypothetical protein